MVGKRRRTSPHVRAEEAALERIEEATVGERRQESAGDDRGCEVVENAAIPVENGTGDAELQAGEEEPKLDGTPNSVEVAANEDEDDEEDEEEMLVVLELADFKNHPILDDYRSITIEGIDTAAPRLHIGEYSLHGQLEETVGTHFFYDTKNRTDQNEYRFAGQTTKKIKFTIAPPDEF
ncbi:hypothetical protein Poli38472_001352 [Pythium oligandrum]|uniref:Transcription factor TFIIIC triple barrel domain-containing protein n=1 Tax=Pythium oligandrum TaxID=41045 RepID=A0A8K1FNB1_PYTOL|nr:hypothetical protein Poli38472_001352 [Pythium oligandrum]|eukprot:TMW69196.1 hypothetical protein Poli38472_001352 [Pythium oligandrum]